MRKAKLGIMMVNGKEYNRGEATRTIVKYNIYRKKKTGVLEKKKNSKT
jgi:hypothetical protein